MIHLLSVREDICFLKRFSKTVDQEYKWHAEAYKIGKWSLETNGELQTRWFGTVCWMLHWPLYNCFDHLFLSSLSAVLNTKCPIYFMQAVAKVLTVSLNFDIMFNLLCFWFMDNKKTIFHELHRINAMSFFYGNHIHFLFSLHCSKRSQTKQSRRKTRILRQQLLTV